MQQDLFRPITSTPDAPKRLKPARMKLDRTEPIETLFLALCPEVLLARHIEGYGRSFLRTYGLKYNPVARAWRPPEWDRLHISLLGLGSCRVVPEDRVSELDLILRSLALPPVMMTLNRLLSFGRGTGNHPLVLTGDEVGMRDLRRRLLDALQPLGLGADNAFNPHLTLSWGPELIPEQEVKPIELTFSEFVLIQSTYNRHRHRILRRWRLRG
ncbi:MAG TPA: 2'-5' RNA ligase family protein [Dongiaceae bacterium]|nr:2'-5' RNA ligase family protein [Dongiaceae bacterium]